MMNRLAIKIFEQEDYAKQFIDGHIYFSAAGRFNNFTDTQRKYDEGAILINDQPIWIDGHELFIPYMFSYEEIKQVPIFCCTLLDKSNTIFFDNNIRYNIPKEHHDLGKFAVIFDLECLIKKIKLVLQPFNAGIIAKKIKYISFNSLNDKNYKQIKTPYDLLFLHDILNGNEKQNEFRITITNRVIDNGHKDARVKIGPHWGWTSKCIHIE